MCTRLRYSLLAVLVIFICLMLLAIACCLLRRTLCCRCVEEGKVVERLAADFACEKCAKYCVAAIYYYACSNARAILYYCITAAAEIASANTHSNVTAYLLHREVRKGSS